VKTFTSFDGIRIAYHDEGEGPAVVLLHGGYVDGLGQFGESGRFWRPVRAPSCRTCVGSEPPTNLERKARTQIQRWPGTSLLSFSTLVLIPRM